MSYVCPFCPAATFCVHGRINEVNETPDAHVETRPASVTAESLAALEQRLAECEKRLESLYKAHEVDRTDQMTKVRNLFSWHSLTDVQMANLDTAVSEAKSLVASLDILSAHTRKRVTALEKAASQQPSRKRGNRRPPARGRSRTKASKKARRGAASSPIRKRAAGRRKT